MQPKRRPCSPPGSNGLGPHHDDRLGRPQRLRHPLGPRAQPQAVRRRTRQHGRFGGTAHAGRREPRRQPVHDGRSSPGRACDPAACGRLSSTPRFRTANWLSRWKRSKSSPAIPATAGATVGSLRDTGVFVLAIVTGEKSYEPNPPADRVLRIGETLVVSGSVDRLKELRRSEHKA